MNRVLSSLFFVHCSLSIVHRSDTMRPIIEILSSCSACGACVEICPVLCLRLHDGLLEIVNEEICFGCRKCEEVCPEEAIHIKGIVP